MKIQIVSDIHGNLVAFDAVLADCGPVDAIWNLGDTVGYGPRPSECIARLRELGANPVLSGNHDLACLGQVDLSRFNPVAALANAWTSSRLSDPDRHYLSGCPSRTEEFGVTLSHGSPRHPVWEYILDARTAQENFDQFDTALCLVGHTHVASLASLTPQRRSVELHRLRDRQMIDLSMGRIICNPGSVGQPRDGDARAAYALLDSANGTIEARRVAYDIRRTQDQMAEAGLPPPLIARLARGR